MKTSAAGRALIVQREGRRLVAYRDTEGILTIGVGHTGRMSPPPVTPGMRITEADCDAMLAADLAPVEKVINTSVTVPISQNEFDAMASLGFNIGAGGLKRSSVIRKLNLGDVRGAADAFMMWSRPAVLASRREAERRQFLAPDARQPAKPTPDRSVATARAKVLARKADKATGHAKMTQVGSTGIAVAGAVTAAATASHHAGIAAGAVLLAALAAIAGTVVALALKARANVLGTNAGRHAQSAADLGTASTDLAQDLTT